MKLEHNKRYELNNGQIVTMKSREYNEGATFYADDVGLYFEDGTFGYGSHCRAESLNVKRCLDGNCTDSDIPQYAAQAAEYGIKITVQIGQIIVEYDGR